MGHDPWPCGGKWAPSPPLAPARRIYRIQGKSPLAGARDTLERRDGTGVECVLEIPRNDGPVRCRLSINPRTDQ